MVEPPDPKARIRLDRERLKLTRGKLIRHVRELLGLSQPELADKVDANGITVSRWEREVGQEPSLFHQRKLAELFGLEVVELGYFQAGDEQASQKLWSVPYQRNPFFVGREEALQRLRDTLVAGKSAVLTHALSGLGGIGKTQLAIEYAYKFQGDYQAVLWAGADSQEILLADVAGIARTLDLRISKKQDQVMYAVRHWLETHSDWLLVLDNVENLRTLDGILPRGKEGYQGHILLTTRRQALGSRAKKIPLETMRADDGATLILRRAKKLPEDAALATATEIDQVKAKDISTEMGGLPLALDQAGAYIEETMCSVGEYLELYLTRRAELLARRGAEPSGHPLSVSTTLSLSIERVRKVNPAACELLTFCSHLHPDAIPEDLIVAGSPELGPLLMAIATDPLQLDKAIQVLGRYSLVHRDAETRMLSVHRLVQAVVQDAMTADHRRMWAERTVQALNRACVGAVLLDERYLPHMQEGARLIERSGLRYRSAASLLAQTGTALRERGLYGQSQPLCITAAQIYQEILLPEEDPAFAQSVLSVALTSARMGTV